MMDDDDDDENDFVRKPSVASNKDGPPKSLPKIPGAKKSVAPPRAPSEAQESKVKLPPGGKALPKLDKPKPKATPPPPPPPPPPPEKKPE